MTEETQTIFKDQTLGIATTILDARIYEQTPHAKMEEQLMRDQGVFNKDPPAESEAAATDTASDADDTETTTAPKVSAEATTEPAAAESTEHVDARVEDKREHAPKRFHYVRPPRKPKAEERPEPPWDDVKPFPTYTKCEWNVEDILYEYGEPPADIDVQRLPFHVQELFTRVTATWTNPWEILGFYHLLDSFSEAFAKDKNDLGSCNLVKHHIDSGDERPFEPNLPNQTAKTIADALLKHWISYWGAPHQLHTDQGRAFDGTLMRELCKLLNVEKTRTTPYHPAGDGQVERYNQTLMHALHAQARNDPDNWDKYIDDAVIAYNSTKHSVTGFEPNRLMVGRNISLPEDLQVPHDPLIQPQYTTKYVRNTAKEMRFCYALVRERLKRAATAMKRYYDRGAKLYHYKEGDAVRVRRFRLNKGTKKFEDFYEGPFYVIDVLGDVTFRVAEGPRSKRRVLHHDSLLPYFNRDPENVVIDNAWVFGVSTTYKPAGDCDAAVQTDAWQPLPAELEQDKNDDDVPKLVEESDEEAELPAVVLDTASAAPNADPATDDEAPCRYVLRSRKVPQANSPPGQRSTAPGTPRRRGRPPKVPPDKRSDMGVQTQVQIDVRLV